MPSTPYRSVLSTAQQRISVAVDQIRKAIPHPGETGALVERLFRSHLEDILPEKVGVSNGFVVDSRGAVSRQMDVILYDKLNALRLFTSEGAQMFPVETTYACGEVKTNMTSERFHDSFEKCLSYKRLSRHAYVRTSNTILTQVHTLFGQQYDHWQSIFFCIAANSISTTSLVPVYHDIVAQRGLQVHERVDTVVSLNAANNQNFLLNGTSEQEDGIPDERSIDFLPYPGSRLFTYPAKEPWSLFVMLLLRYMTQVPTTRIDMLPYGGEEPY